VTLLAGLPPHVDPVNRTLLAVDDPPARPGHRAPRSLDIQMLLAVVLFNLAGDCSMTGRSWRE
jgi:hypothetical protein